MTPAFAQQRVVTNVYFDWNVTSLDATAIGAVRESAVA